MTIERYLAICYPLRAATWFTVRRAVVIVAMETLLIMGLNLQHLIIRETYIDEGSGNLYCRTIPGFTTFYAQKIWPWIDGVLYCYGPLLCLCVFNILIVRQVKASRSFQSKTTLSDTTSSADQRSSGNKMSSKMTTQESQLTRMLLLVTTAFLVCVGPMGVSIVVERYFWERDTNPQYAVYYFIRTILNNLDYTNHALNFYLYCLSGKRFRRELANTFSCFCPARTQRKKTDASGRGVRMTTQSRDSLGSSMDATVVTET
ncbi:mu-type opioid receptor-like [Littorina saxatilis]|uniref:mu-type opioid receptor-like n=1 Tax=Littorina saxatilis TaxID=31220 RepID=UPI0038B513DA